MDSDEASTGISLFIAVQNYTATGGGLPKAIRGNATHLTLWRTKTPHLPEMTSSSSAAHYFR